MKKILKFNLPLIVLMLVCSQVYAQGVAGTWDDLVNTTASSNTLTKTSGGKNWNAGAADITNVIPASTDGWAEFTITEAKKRMVFGLSPSNADVNYNSIHFGVNIKFNNTLGILESGVVKPTASLGYSPGDVIRVERTGTTIEYKKNGTTFYTSLVSSSTQLLVDVTMYDPNGVVSNLMVNTGGGSPCSTTVYADTDGDGFGDPNTTTTDCSDPLPAGWVADNTDCDDTDGDINPNTIWYADTDGDNFGDPAVSQTQCAQPVGYVLDNTDCDDTANSPSNDCGGGGAGPSVWTQSGNNIHYSDGKVWIGDAALDIASDDYNLFVEKGIMTERVKVSLSNSNDWADYVFKNGYQLMTLEEVWSHILEKGHLPNVPSANQVAEQGIDVSKMFPTLLRQIEENKLYLIQMNEEIKTLKEENEELKQQISKETK